MLDYLAYVHCTWAEWLELHPDTEVMDLPDDPKHKDPRGGHASEEYWERPGIDKFMIAGLVSGELDRQLPENVTCIGVNLPQGVKAYPVRDTKLEGGLTHDKIGDVPLLIISGPATDSYFTGVFDRRVDGKVLEFKPQKGTGVVWNMVDNETGTVWNPEGLAIDGKLKGKQLTPVHYGFCRWHSWIYTHPTTEIYRTKRTEAPDIEEGVFAQLLKGLHDAKYKVKVKREIINDARLLQTDRGLILDINGDRLLFHHFTNETACRDYCALTPHILRAGWYVLQSDPPDQFTDIATNITRLPAEEINWSKLLEDENFVQAFQSAAPKETGPDYPGFSDLVGAINQGGYDFFPGAPELHFEIPYLLPWGTYIGLRPGEENMFLATINASDHFEIHRWKTEEGAEEYKNYAKHAFRVGRYVFQHVPLAAYQIQMFRMGDKPDDKVMWSDILEDEDFKNIVRSVVEGAPAKA